MKSAREIHGKFHCIDFLVGLLVAPTEKQKNNKKTKNIKKKLNKL